MRKRLPKELSDFFNRRRHAFGSKRHWKKRFLNGEGIGLWAIRNLSDNSSRKLVKWMEAHGAVYAVACDEWRMPQELDAQTKSV